METRAKKIFIFQFPKCVIDFLNFESPRICTLPGFFGHGMANKIKNLSSEKVLLDLDPQQLRLF